jgi:hypothetical protein
MGGTFHLSDVVPTETLIKYVHPQLWMRYGWDTDEIADKSSIFYLEGTVGCLIGCLVTQLDI